MGVRCKHGMDPAWCSYCLKENQPAEVKRKQVRQPAQRKDTTTFGAEALTQDDLNLAGWVVVHVHLGRENAEFTQLDRATHVHVCGLPFLWVIERILEKAPKLRQIRVIPSFYNKLHPESHLKLCAEHGVEGVTGHISPALAWAEGENRSRFYTGQRQFLLNLKDEQKALWEELLAMNFEAVQMTARYFCLNGEGFISKSDIARQHGFSVHNSETTATDLTNAVIFYLDPTFECGPRAQQIANRIKPKVVRLRKYFEAVDHRRVLAEELGLENLPTDLPLSRYEIFKELVAAQRAGKLASLVDNRRGQALDLRFGLTSGHYLILEKVGEQMDITRERVRQLEEEGLGLLGIQED